MLYYHSEKRGCYKYGKKGANQVEDSCNSLLVGTCCVCIYHSLPLLQGIDSPNAKVTTTIAQHSLKSFQHSTW